MRSSSTQKGFEPKFGIYPFQPIKQNGLEIIIHDSWGLEADKAKSWSDLINNQVNERNKSSKIDDWFHTIIYCVSAKGARLEDFEINSIIRPLIKQGNDIVFALTKSDIASSTEYHAIEKILEGEFPNATIVECCSISQTLRNGDKTEPFGKEELSKAIMQSLCKSLIYKIKVNFSTYCMQSSEEWKLDVLRFYEKKSSLFKTRASLHKEVASHAKEKSDLMLKLTEQWLVAAINESQIIFDNFGASFAGTQFIKDHKNSNLGLDFKTNNIEWDGYDAATNATLNSVPIVNLLYWAVADGLHKDILEEKLNDEVEKFKTSTQASLKKIDKYLLQRFLIK